ncbi:MAG: lipopolysaccharide heptosyltransferase II [Proteobacteria bacterium]|nr:lipopolysaccharide heptosyltransferase II [Pseudomonadota bacterium]
MTKSKIERKASKILIVGPAWVGDMVMAQSLFKLLKQEEPTVTIDVLAPDWTRPLLERMPEVHQAIAMPVGHGQFHLGERYKLAKVLEKNQYDQSIVLPNSWKSALIPFLARIPRRTGWLGEMRFGLLNDFRFLNKKTFPLMVNRFMALGLPANDHPPAPILWPKLQISQTSLQTTLKNLNLSKDQKPILALCPGAEFGPSKRWPENYFAEVAQEKLKQGWQVWLFGSKNDMPVAEQIQALTNQQCVNLTGRTALAEAIDLLSIVDVVVSNDSGLMHIAAALEKPLVVVYGSTDPRFTPPLASKVEILTLQLPCSPCFKRVCPLEHLKCMQDLKPVQVLEALNSVTA